MDILVLIFNMVINVAVLLLGLRFMMQLAQIDPYNPVVVSTVRATHVADVFGRIFPPLAQGRVNLAAAVLIVLLFLLDQSGNALLSGVAPDGPFDLLIKTIFAICFGVLTFCKWLIIGSIILSWVVMFTQSQSPYIAVVMQLAEPLLAPFRKILPDLGPIDLSPMVAFLAIIICQRLLGAAVMSLGLY